MIKLFWWKVRYCLYGMWISKYFSITFWWYLAGAWIEYAENFEVSPKDAVLDEMSYWND